MRFVPDVIGGDVSDLRADTKQNANDTTRLVSQEICDRLGERGWNHTQWKESMRWLLKRVGLYIDMFPCGVF